MSAADDAPILMPVDIVSDGWSNNTEIKLNNQTVETITAMSLEFSINGPVRMHLTAEEVPVHLVGLVEVHYHVPEPGAPDDVGLVERAATMPGTYTDPQP